MKIDIFSNFIHEKFQKLARHQSSISAFSFKTQAFYFKARKFHTTNKPNKSKQKPTTWQPQTTSANTEKRSINPQTHSRIRVAAEGRQTIHGDRGLSDEQTRVSKGPAREGNERDREQTDAPGLLTRGATICVCSGCGVGTRATPSGGPPHPVSGSGSCIHICLELPSSGQNWSAGPPRGRVVCSWDRGWDRKINQRVRRQDKDNGFDG